MSTAAPFLPPLTRQADRLVALGVHELACLTAAELRTAAGSYSGADALLVVAPDRAPVSAISPMLQHAGKTGFVVEDMTDVDEFTPIDRLALPRGPVYVLEGLDRGELMLNWSPNEALVAFAHAERVPLTLGEGIQWLLQLPQMLQRGRCFMTIGSRLRRPDGSLDARTPAVWISNGTGRDGRARKDAPKVGWCWAGNRHSWLGFASASARHQAPA